jgi:hypothetical protein
VAEAGKFSGLSMIATTVSGKGKCFVAQHLAQDVLVLAQDIEVEMVVH